MTKAYLMNSARYMTGVDANDNLWSNNQGTGELDLGTAFDGVVRTLRDEVLADKFTASGQTRTFSGTISNPSQPFRVTLAWTDAPGSTIGPALNNDLDLTVSVGGSTYKGNVFHGNHSVAGGSADHLNNVESVFLPAGTTGSFDVTITAANINSDAVPGDADPLDQDFALVIYNGETTASGCIYSLNSVSANLSAAGTRSKSVKVKASSTDCVWTAVSNDPLIAITAGSNGIGNGTVRCTVPGNTNTVPLTGTMTIAGQTVTVNQAAGGCVYGLSPTKAKFSAAGGSKTVKVKARFADCVWTAVSNDPFITIITRTNGVGKGVVGYSVAANTNLAARLGTLTIAGQTYIVTQSAAP